MWSAEIFTQHAKQICWQEGAGDANDVWMIDIPGVEEGARVLAVRSKLKLIHYHVKCALQSHDKKLPKW